MKCIIKIINEHIGTMYYKEHGMEMLGCVMDPSSATVMTKEKCNQVINELESGDYLFGDEVIDIERVTSK